MFIGPLPIKMLLRLFSVITVAAAMMASSSKAQVAVEDDPMNPKSLRDLPPGSKYYVYPKESPQKKVAEWGKRHLARFLFLFPPTTNWINKKATNKASTANGQVPNRPFKLSCLANYTSVTSLMNETYYGRHLSEAPPGYTDTLPSINDVVSGLFPRGVDSQIIDPKGTMLFPVFAQMLIDSFISTVTYTNTTTKKLTFDWKRTNSPFEINLLPLYGRFEYQTDALRLKSEKSRGRLKSQIINGEEYAEFLYNDLGEIKDEFQVLGPPQAFNQILSKVDKTEEEKRKIKSKIFAFGGNRTNTTPQMAALNTLFLREHNRLAGQLEKHNEDWDDDRVFQTARNINLVIYLKIIIEEYINHITSSGARFKVQPKEWVWNADWNKPNWIAVEFAVLYRWHALTPNSYLWEGKRVKISDDLFNNALLLETSGGLRQAIAEISKNPATIMAPFNTALELLSQEQAAFAQTRQANVRPFADYRAYLGLPLVKTFKDITQDKEVQQKLEELYKTPDRVEFWAGLVAEDKDPKAIFGPTLSTLVALDAFSQALTHPLLSEQVFNEETFSPWGYRLLKEGNNKIKDLVERNTNHGAPLTVFIGMTNPNWHL